MWPAEFTKPNFLQILCPCCALGLLQLMYGLVLPGKSWQPRDTVISPAFWACNTSCWCEIQSGCQTGLKCLMDSGVIGGLEDKHCYRVNLVFWEDQDKSCPCKTKMQTFTCRIWLNSIFFQIWVDINICNQSSSWIAEFVQFRKWGGLKSLTLGWSYDQFKLFLPEETHELISCTESHIFPTI